VRRIWFCLVIATACAAGPCSIGAEEFPAELTRFTAYQGNPVFTAGTSGQWDERIRERGWIVKEGDTWHLWYTGYRDLASSAKSLGYATSTDGLSWRRHPANPVYTQAWVEDMMVVRHCGAWYMFAEGEHDQSQLLISGDGLNWKREGRLDVRTTTGIRIPDGPYGTPTVWVAGETWYLFYERGDRGVWVARSSDLRVWTNVTDRPVLSPGPDAYDRELIALNQIICHGGRYYAWYHGSGSREKPRLWSTCLAASGDLVHWKKFPGNPLLPERENKSSGIVVHDGTAYRLYTMHDQVHVHFSLSASK
jgi:hypothetical protein